MWNLELDWRRNKKKKSTIVEEEEKDEVVEEEGMEKWGRMKNMEEKKREGYGGMERREGDFLFFFK